MLITYIRNQPLSIAYIRFIFRFMGRKKLWDERVLVPLAKETVERLEAVRHEDEDRLDVIRAGIERELKLRERKSSKG
jgi:hypothetical protein